MLVVDQVDSLEVGRSGREQSRHTEPVRTCVGCRRRAAKTDLLRVVLAIGENGSAVSSRAAVPDPGFSGPGRGAYLHPTHECLRWADQRRAFSRALRVSGPVDIGPVREYLAVSARDEHEQTVRT